MKRILIITLNAVLISSPGWCQPDTYKLGESVYYNVHYGPISAGEASLELKPGTYKGMPFWHSKLVGKTTGMADAIFRVVHHGQMFRVVGCNTLCKHGTD
ncbi:MAG: DUF3108 domain-containing protein [Caldiserica bacterium]|nr:DUF3108 domain-containing protein [Caldisericota bacterium]